MVSYFKVDKRIYALTNKMISEKAFKLYILYCNEVNKDKYLGCCLMGARHAKKVLGLMPGVFENARQELIDKHFIALRPDVRTGHLSTVAVEVLEFPNVDAKLKRFSANSQIHRDYPAGKYVNIPKEIIGKIKFLNFDTLMLLLEIYNNIVDGIVSINFTHVYCSKNRLGYKLQGDTWAKVDTEAYWYYTTNNGDSLNQLVLSGLLYTQYALIYEDANDKEYCCIKTMLNESEDDYEEWKKGAYIFPRPYSRNEKVIKVLIPVYKLEFPEKKETNNTKKPDTTGLEDLQI